MNRPKHAVFISAMRIMTIQTTGSGNKMIRRIGAQELARVTLQAHIRAMHLEQRLGVRFMGGVTPQAFDFSDRPVHDRKLCGDARVTLKANGRVNVRHVWTEDRLGAAFVTSDAILVGVGFVRVNDDLACAGSLQSSARRCHRCVGIGHSVEEEAKDVIS